MPACHIVWFSSRTQTPVIYHGRKPDLLMYVKLVLSQMRNIWVEYITSNVKKQNAFKAEKDVNSFEWLSFRLQ